VGIGSGVREHRSLDHAAAFLRRFDGERVIRGAVGSAFACLGLRTPTAMDHAGGHQEREAELTRAARTPDETVE
jgi:hypothetical protein